MPSIEAVHLTKSFHRATPSLDNVSFRYEGPRAVGYLGPNGAGKSTTLKLLVGLLNPTRGRAILNGREARFNRRDALADVGAVIETPEPYPTQSVREALSTVGRIRGLTSEGVDAEIARLHQELLLPRLERRCGGLSKGQRQRVVLAAAMIGDPSVLLLDEPTSGLDPAERILVRALLTRLKQDHLILLVSHQVADVAEVCDDLVFLDRGRMILQDSLANVSARVRVRQVDLEFLRPTPPPSLDSLGPGIESVVPLSDRRFRITFDGSDDARARILDAARRIGPVGLFSPSTPALERAYLDVVRSANA
ncbi:MAG TPA: ABC transporter ATP-binding protein [Thermoplasmata archaeon]|nr:ABC transporter ATP-binding protein [Thermoplasmata archaeon]